MSLVAYFSVWIHRNPLDRRAVPSRSFKACSQNSPVQPVRTLFLPPTPEVKIPIQAILNLAPEFKIPTFTPCPEVNM